ncbi:MAG: DUF1206 domain-containing protein [Fuerstiella sp.]
MASATSPAKTAESRDHRDWIEWLARAGYIAKGVVYLIIGVLAVQVAMGDGGQTTGAKGALAVIAGEPFGQTLLVLTGIGLIGYALWRIVQAVTDPDDEGSDSKGIAVRVAYAGSGILHVMLAIEAFRIAMGSAGGGGNDGSAQHWTRQLMEQPFGIWLVGAAGGAALAGGAVQIYRAYSAKFMGKLRTQSMNSTERTWSERIGRAGFAARGVVFFVIGGGLVNAAMTTDPSEAVGFGQALSQLSGTSYGPWVLGLVAVGLAAYGAFCAGVLGRYRRIFIDT